MTSPKVQQAIFEHIKQQFSEEINLADFLSPILNLNKNAVYKRLSGITANFFQQHSYIAESRLYERSEDIEQLLTCSKELIFHLKKIAHAGKRFLPSAAINESSAEVEFYFNETIEK